MLTHYGIWLDDKSIRTLHIIKDVKIPRIISSMEGVDCVLCQELYFALEASVDKTGSAQVKFSQQTILDSELEQ